MIRSTVAYLVLLMAALSSCAPDRGIALLESPNLKTSEIGGTLGRVCQRHDAYVQNDGALDPGTKQTYLNDTIFLRGVLIQTTVAPSLISAPLSRVCTRHDIYVIADPRWNALQLRANLRDSALMRLAVSAPATQPAASP